MLDESGQPIRNFNVKILPPVDRRPNDVLKGFAALYSSVGVSFTRNDGRFVVTDIGAGATYRIRISSREFLSTEIDRVVAMSGGKVGDTNGLRIVLNRGN